MFLIDDLLLAPVKGIIGLGKKINEMIERESSDEGRLKEKLMELQLQFEMDEVSEEEYQKQEKELLENWETMRKSRAEEN